MHSSFIHSTSLPAGPSGSSCCACRCSRLCRGSSAWEGSFREAQHAPAAQHKDRCSNRAKGSRRRRRSWQGKGHRWWHWLGHPLPVGSMSNTIFWHGSHVYLMKLCWPRHCPEAQHTAAAQRTDCCSNKATGSCRRRQSWYAEGHCCRHSLGRPLQAGSMSSTSIAVYTATAVAQDPVNDGCMRLCCELINDTMMVSLILTFTCAPTSLKPIQLV